MDIEHFNTCLALYGSSLNDWPDDIKDSAQKMLSSHPELHKKIEEEIAFEVLLNQRTDVEDNPDFAQQIIAQANQAPVQTETPHTSLYQHIRALLAPKPVIAFACALACIFVLSFALSPDIPHNEAIDMQLLTEWDENAYDEYFDLMEESM